MQISNKIRKDLFDKIRSRCSDLSIGDENGNVTNEPENATFFEFSYTDQDSEELGKISISLQDNEDEKDEIVVIFSQDIVKDQPSETRSRWFDFLKDLRGFAKKRLLNFSIRDIRKSNLTKRDYKFLSNNKTGENEMNESLLYGTSTNSYQKIGGARIHIKHNQPINTESAHGRNYKIGRIYVESPDGEKFKYPRNHLNGARAMALHVSEGGNPYDDFGKYITGLSEELASLKKFNMYMNRNGVMAEALANYTSIVKERSTSVRKEIKNLQNMAFYQEKISNFQPAIVEQVPKDIEEAWVEQLTIKQFNEELKDIFPYIYNLVGNNYISEVTADDLDVDERTLSKAELKRRNDIVDGMSDADFKKRYGKRWRNVMFATATNQAKGGRESSVQTLGKQQIPLGEFILSYFDRETMQFPKGETAVLTMVEKNYGDQYVKPASEFIGQVSERMQGFHTEANDFSSRSRQNDPLVLSAVWRSPERTAKINELLLKSEQAREKLYNKILDAFNGDVSEARKNTPPAIWKVLTASESAARIWEPPSKKGRGKKVTDPETGMWHTQRTTKSPSARTKLKKAGNKSKDSKFFKSYGDKLDPSKKPR